MKCHCSKILVVVLTVTSICSGCTNQDNERCERLIIFAAASLTDAITQISKSFESIHDVRIYANFASSSTLQMQIEKGAPADLFISASPIQIDALENQRMIDESTRCDVLRNRLVMVSLSVNSVLISDPRALLQPHFRRIAIGEPNSVPAGIYGQESLKSFGIWSEIQSKLIFAADVRGVLAYVASGEVDLGIVYRTDVTMSRNAQIVYEFPSSSHTPIRYPAAIIRGTKRDRLARAFLEYLKICETTAVFENYGFSSVR